MATSDSAGRMVYSLFSSRLRRAALAAVAGAGSLSAQAPTPATCTGVGALAWYSRALGFSLRRRAVVRGNTVVVFAYPLVTEVVRQSPADSAGLRVGDEFLLLDRSNLVMELGSLRTPDSLVRTSMVFRRGEIVKRRTAVPRTSPPCHQ